MTAMIEKMKSWVSLLPPIGYTNILEIVILAVLVYEFLLWIKNTRAWELLKGLVVIAAFITAAAILHLTTIMWLIERISTAAIIATVVIFQPELRKALEQLGSRMTERTMQARRRSMKSSARPLRWRRRRRAHLS